MRCGLAGLALSVTGSAQAESQGPTLTKEAINGATFQAPPEAPKAEPDAPAKGRKVKQEAKDKSGKAADPLLVKVQVLLDRQKYSPGAIDGRDGENLQLALSAYAAAQKLPTTKSVTREVFDKLAAASNEPVVTDYTITGDDLEGPFRPIPPKMEAQAELDGMGYTTPREMLAERFHMQRDLLSTLNPDKPLDKAGTVILVAAVAPMGTGKVEDRPLLPKVARVEVDKTTKRVRSFSEDGTLVADYPASIGSSEKPAPSGRTKVKGVAFEPWYTYNPKYRFKGVKSRSKFSIHPGPNNPVGLVWIDLALPSYGIHGSPEPEKIGKTESHGCIRLTNWDARDLASHVEKGAKVEFLDR